MSTEPRNVTIDLLLKSRHAHRIEFWHDNGNGTCTRLADGLTLSQPQIDALYTHTRPGHNLN